MTENKSSYPLPTGPADSLQTPIEQSTQWLLERNEQLKRSEERYHKMIEEVQDYAIILLDPQGIIQTWNRGAEHIKQYREDEVVGQHFRLFYLPQDRADRLPERLLNEAVVHGRAVHEGWRMRKDQTRFWGSISLTALHGENNEVIGFSKVTRDLTELKWAENKLMEAASELRQRNEALRTSEERFQKMIAEVQDYAIILLDEEGLIRNWNTGAEKIKGYTSAEVLGQHFRIFYPERDRNDKVPESLLALAADQGRALHEGWRVRKDGSKFWGSIVLTALHGKDGSVIGFSKVTRDLTERKLAEDKMAIYLQELEFQNKELEQFAYVASHDLQEPLRKIQTFVNMVERHYNDPEQSKKYIVKINAAAQRMRELIHAVLHYGRITREGSELEDVDLNSILANVLVDFELMIGEKKAAIYSNPLPTIRAVPLQVNQILTNLIGNALKFSSTDPEVHISSQVLAREQIPDAPATLDAGHFLELKVADNGIGFDQQYAKLIFTMFQRLHDRNSYAGTGIGLALCKKIMDLHHGFIRAEGALGQGASFYVYFPVESGDKELRTAG